LKTGRGSIFSVMHHKKALPWTLCFMGGSAVGRDISLVFSSHPNTEVLKHWKSKERFCFLTDTQMLDFSCPVTGTHNYWFWLTKLCFQPLLLPLLLLWQDTVAKCEGNAFHRIHIDINP